MLSLCSDKFIIVPTICLLPVLLGDMVLLFLLSTYRVPACRAPTSRPSNPKDIFKRKPVFKFISIATDHTDIIAVFPRESAPDNTCKTFIH